MKGKPWRPSTKNPGSRIRTCIKEDDEEDGSDEDEEGERPVEVNFQEEEDIDITIDEVKEAQDLIFNRAGLKYNFAIKAKDVYKYDAT